MKPCIGLPLNEEAFTELVDKAKDWALMHGKIKINRIF